MNTLLIAGLLFNVVFGNQNVIFKTYSLNSDNYKPVYQYQHTSQSWSSQTTFSDIKIGSFTESGETFTYDCVLNYRFPSYTSQSISSAYLSLYKYSGSATVKVEYNHSFNFSTDPNNSSWSNLGNLTQQGNNYVIYFTQLLQSSLGSGYAEINFRISAASSSGSIVFGGGSYTSTINPFISVNYSATPNYNTNGNASPYVFHNFTTASIPDTTNCYGYAINGKGVPNCSALFNGGHANISNPTENINNIINTNKTVFNVNTRQISDYNSPIFPFERRIAFRYNISDNSQLGTYHFLRQTSDGKWASTNGYQNITKKHNYYDPSTFDWGAEWGSPSLYDGTIYYFAISCLGGHSAYEAY